MRRGVRAATRARCEERLERSARGRRRGAGRADRREPSTASETARSSSRSRSSLSRCARATSGSRALKLFSARGRRQPAVATSSRRMVRGRSTSLRRRASEGRGRRTASGSTTCAARSSSSRSARAPTSGSPRPRRPGPARAASFEERVHDAIERIAEGRGDAAHHVGDEREAGGKKGDTVVEIGAGERRRRSATVVFEAKDKQLSKNEAWKELNACDGASATPLRGAGRRGRGQGPRQAASS